MTTDADVVRRGWHILVQCSLCGKNLEFESDGGTCWADEGRMTYNALSVRPHICDEEALRALCADVRTGEVDEAELAAIQAEASWVGWGAPRSTLQAIDAMVTSALARADEVGIGTVRYEDLRRALLDVKRLLTGAGVAA